MCQCISAVIHVCSSWRSTKAPAQLMWCCLTSWKLFTLCSSGSFRNGTLSPGHAARVMFSRFSYGCCQRLKIRLNMKLVAFLKPLLVPASTSVLLFFRLLTEEMHSLKYVSWILHICYIKDSLEDSLLKISEWPRVQDDSTSCHCPVEAKDFTINIFGTLLSCLSLCPCLWPLLHPLLGSHIPRSQQWDFCRWWGGRWWTTRNHKH